MGSRFYILVGIYGLTLSFCTVRQVKYNRDGPLSPTVKDIDGSHRAPETAMSLSDFKLMIVIEWHILGAYTLYPD